MRDVKAMSERDLAEYQSGYKTSSAEWKVCEEEFERKARHAGDARRSWIAIWISVAALALTALNSPLIYYK